MVFVHSVRTHHSFSPSSLSRKTLSHPKPSLPFLSLKLNLNLKATSAASLFSTASSSRLVTCVAVSSEFQQDEEDFVGGSQEREPNFSPDLKLFVGNLPFNVDSSDLAALFERTGNFELVEVIYDKLTGRSRGFGFVTMSSVQEVEAAEQQFNGYIIVRLLQIIVDGRNNMAVRQVASIHFKNFIARNWSPQEPGYNLVNASRL